MKRSMKGLYYFFRAGFIVGTAVSFPTLWKAVGKKTTKIALYHGMGPRSTSSGSDDHEITNGRVFRTTKGIIKDINKWDYFVFTSQYTSSIIGKLQFHLPKAKRIVMGYPRCDHLLNSSFVIRRYNNKEILRQYFPEARSSSKLILYAPTWRITNTDLSFPMNLIKKFDMKHLSEYLKLNGFYMLISMHGRVSSMESFNGYGDRIQYLRRDPLFDINMLLPEVSMLISDYSTIITEFALLDRPIIYIMPDYDYFLYERGLLEDIRDNLAGKEARSMEELVNIIDKYNLNPRADADLRKNYLRKYYDVSIKDSSYRIYEFMDKLKKDKIGLAVTQPNI
jgi:CDP-glycerol glycerophosphotransferase